MKVTREGLSHAYKRAKSITHATWERTKHFVDTADKVVNLTARGLIALGDRVNPDVRQTAGRALVRYGDASQKFKNVSNNVDRIGDAIRDVGFVL